MRAPVIRDCGQTNRTGLITYWEKRKPGQDPGVKVYRPLHTPLGFSCDHSVFFIYKSKMCKWAPLIFYNIY